jgi:hypothetical protein
MHTGFSKRYMQRNPHIVLLNLEFYHTKVKPVVARWIVLHLRARRIGAVLPTDRAVEYIVSGYSDELAQSAQGEVTVAKLRASRDLDALVLTTLSENERQLLNLGRDWCETFLPHW